MSEGPGFYVMTFVVLFLIIYWVVWLIKKVITYVKNKKDNKEI